MKTLTLEPRLTDAEADALKGETLTDDSYDTLIDEDCDVLKPDGTPLLSFRKKVLPEGPCITAFESMRDAPILTDNRGVASGKLTQADIRPDITGAAFGHAEGFRVRSLKKDGSLSKTNRTRKVRSNTLGFMDRSVRFPYCRMTKWTADNYPKFQSSLPFFEACSDIFRDVQPTRWGKQYREAELTHPDFRIGNTPFTTITVNKNWQTAVHKDKGDYPEGFGVMTAMWAGKGDGLHLVFPQYKVAVRIRTTDLILADVHEWHGNSPPTGILGQYERLSFVLYLRTNMGDCLSAKQELDQAKNLDRKGISR